MLSSGRLDGYIRPLCILRHHKLSFILIDIITVVCGHTLENELACFGGCIAVFVIFVKGECFPVEGIDHRLHTGIIILRLGMENNFIADTRLIAVQLKGMEVRRVCILVNIHTGIGIAAVACLVLYNGIEIIIVLFCRRKGVVVVFVRCHLFVIDIQHHLIQCSIVCRFHLYGVRILRIETAARIEAFRLNNSDRRTCRVIHELKHLSVGLTAPVVGRDFQLTRTARQAEGRSQIFIDMIDPYLIPAAHISCF